MHFTGIGKPSYIAGYAVSLTSSTGAPAYYLHGTEAVHGSSDQLVPGDVVVCISNSGNTEELKLAIHAIKMNGCKIIGISSNPESFLRNNSAVHITAKVEHEGDTLNRAPRLFVIVQIFAVMDLSIVLQGFHNITPSNYVCWHPGGALGNLRKNKQTPT